MNLTYRQMRESERLPMCEMISAGGDVSEDAVDLLARQDARYIPFLALDGYGIVGMISGSVDSDFSDNEGWNTFDVPPPPHGFIERMYVTPRYRRHRVGRALVLTYAQFALHNGCTFIGGSVDESDDTAGRRAFFASCGFKTGGRLDGEDYNFAAQPRKIVNALQDGSPRS